MLLPTTIAIVGARSLVSGARISEPRDILALPWLQEYGTNEMTLWLKKRGVMSPKSENLTHLPGYMVIEGLLHGEGVSAVSRALVAPEIKSGQLVVLFEDTAEPTDYHIVTRPGVKRPAIKAFVGWLRHQAHSEKEHLPPESDALIEQPDPIVRNQ